MKKSQIKKIAKIAPMVLSMGLVITDSSYNVNNADEPVKLKEALQKNVETTCTKKDD